MLELVFYAVALPVIYTLEREAIKGQQPLDPFEGFLFMLVCIIGTIAGTTIIAFLFY
jgi:hypothetical protein